MSTSLAYMRGDKEIKADRRRSNAFTDLNDLKINSKIRSNALVIHWKQYKERILL